MLKDSTRITRNRLVRFIAEPEYYRQMLHIAIPIAVQNLIMSSLNMVGVLMIGQLGETSLAAVGLANQVFFLLQLVLFGITSGSAMFTAQLWGKKDIPNVRRVLGLSNILALIGSGIFLVLTQAAPEAVLRLYSEDPAVIALGGSYLRTFGWAYLFTAVTFSYAAVLRSIGDVKTPLVVSIAALSFNTLFSYALIFGKLGLPALGVHGAALAGIFARVLECGALLLVIYLRRSPAAATLGEMVRLNFTFVMRVLKSVAPVMANELLWSLGITTYYAVYAHISTDSVAAMNIAATIDNLALVIFIGLANACAILVGNQIGAGKEPEAHRYAARSLCLGLAGAVLVGGLILLISNPILSLYKVSPLVIQYTQKILLIIACLLWLRVTNLLLFIGIFRSGGDTIFAFLLDGVIIWALGVPMAAYGAFVLDLPVYWVYLMVMSEEFTKCCLGIYRFFSKKWIHNLAQTV